MRVGRTEADDIFLLMLSAGPDSLVLHRLLPMLKKLGGRVGVAVQALLELLRPASMPEITVEAGGRTMSAGWVIVGNATCYAGPMRATPGADPFEPMLEVVVHTAKGRWKAVAFMLDLVRGRHTRRADVLTLRTDEVRIHRASSRSDLRYQIDGDVAGPLPVGASLHPATLLIRLPGQI